MPALLRGSSDDEIASKFPAFLSDTLRSPGGRSGRLYWQEVIEPQKIGAALNAYDREFPVGRNAEDIRNLRGLLAWRTQDWRPAVDLTLQTLADEHDPALQQDAARRLQSIFVGGLTDETERQGYLAAVKARTAAVERLKEFLPKSPRPPCVLGTWLLAQLRGVVR